jgi:hypothetical protein
MKLDRRTTMKGSALLGASALLPLSAARATADQPLMVYDSRLKETHAFLQGRQGHPRLDIAGEEGSLWQAAREVGPRPRTAEGLTRWSDYVQLREIFEEHGLRVVAERKLAASLAGRGELFRWSMQAR